MVDCETDDWCMELKPDELKYVERYIHRLEKDSKHWRWMRWAGVFVAILISGTAIYEYCKVIEIVSLVTSSYPSARPNVDSKGIELLMEGRISNLRLEFITLLGTTLKGIFAAILFVYCLVNWNRHIRSALIAKALRRFALKQ